MRKLKFACTVSIAAFLFATNVYANAASVSSFEKAVVQQDKTYSSVVSFEITSGLTKDTESTFDETRTVVGAAPKDTMITLETYAYNEEDESFSLVDSYETTVGTSGIFSKSVDLAIGQNYILITASKDSNQSIKATLINRKDLDIKAELEQSIVLPGQKPVYSRLSAADSALQTKK